MTGLRRPVPHDVELSLPQSPLSCVCFLASLKYSWECRHKYYTFQPCIIVTYDHFWHYAIKQISLYLLFKNFTCTCLHRLLLTMRLWLSLFAAMDPQLHYGALGPWLPLNFLSLFSREDLLFIFPKI